MCPKNRHNKFTAIHKIKHQKLQISFLPMLNSKMTTTVRIAQTEYWPRSLKGSFKNMRRDTRVRAKLILAAKITFRGSDRPNSHPFEKRWRRDLYNLENLSPTLVQQWQFDPFPSSKSYPWTHSSGSRLFFIVSS